MNATFCPSNEIPKNIANIPKKIVETLETRISFFSLLFPLQIYFDFSGYVDMALGISKILGISLPINFDRPYLSKSLTEFWRRWHITLSRWFRDYLYIPLGGSRVNKLKTYYNLLMLYSYFEKACYILSF